MSYSSQDGYVDAVAIDEILNRILQEHDTSNPHNRPGYLALIRTVHSSLNLIRPQVGLTRIGRQVMVEVPE